MGIWAFMAASKLLWPWKGAPCGMTITVIRTSSICPDTALLQEQIFPFLSQVLSALLHSLHTTVFTWLPATGYQQTQCTACPMFCSSHIASVWGQNHQGLRALQITIKLFSTNWKNVRILSFPLFWTESQKNKVNVALNSRFKITRNKICKGLVLYFTVQLFNSLLVLASSTDSQSSDFWVYKLF